MPFNFGVWSCISNYTMCLNEWCSLLIGLFPIIHFDFNGKCTIDSNTVILGGELKQLQ